MSDGFTKHDKGKTRYELVPPSLTKGVAEVLTFGAEKYEANNWKKAGDLNRYVGALYRHLESWRAGESTDPESGFKHLAHAATNLAFLIDLDHKSTEWNNNKEK